MLSTETFALIHAATASTAGPHAIASSNACTTTATARFFARSPLHDVDLAGATFLNVAGLTSDEIREQLRVNTTNAVRSGDAELSAASTTRITANAEFYAVGVDLVANNLRAETHSGGDFDCRAPCRAKYPRQCKAAIWNNYRGGTCWLKTAIGARRLRTGAYAYAYYSEGAAKVFLYETFPDCDIKGYDAGGMACASPAACPLLCYKYPLCWAYTWTSDEGGTCWFKGVGASPVKLLGASCGLVQTAAVLAMSRSSRRSWMCPWRAAANTLHHTT